MKALINMCYIYRNKANWIDSILKKTKVSIDFLHLQSVRIHFTHHPSRETFQDSPFTKISLRCF